MSDLRVDLAAVAKLLDKPRPKPTHFLCPYFGVVRAKKPCVHIRDMLNAITSDLGFKKHKPGPDGCLPEKNE